MREDVTDRHTHTHTDRQTDKLTTVTLCACALRVNKPLGNYCVLARLTTFVLLLLIKWTDRGKKCKSEVHSMNRGALYTAKTAVISDELLHSSVATT